MGTRLRSALWLGIALAGPVLAGTPGDAGATRPGEMQGSSLGDSGPAPIGSLDKELIRQVIHANRAQIRFCYERRLDVKPTLAGKVAVRFHISASGAVSSAAVSDSTVADVELGDCVVAR